MATWIRRLVSKNKRRFQDGPHGFDLDLAYIAPRIIAMGLPAEGKDVLYRNPLPEIARFLTTYHGGHAKVYNLCSEHRYSADKLPGVLLQQFPFDDHQTPALVVVQQFCANAAAWLAAHPHNVVAVHCKAGKGRTGIMICCLMLYLHLSAPALANLPGSSSADAAALPQPPRDVLELYAARRTHDLNGVSIPSQRRYVSYFWRVLSSGPKPLGRLPQPRSLQLRQIHISGLPPGSAEQCSVVVEVRPSGSSAAGGSRVFASRALRPAASSVPGVCLVPCAAPPQVQDGGCSVAASPAGDSLTLTLPAASLGLSLFAARRGSSSSSDASDVNEFGEQAGCCVVEGDVRILVLRGGAKLFYSWFNTAFLPAGGCYSLSRHQLDKPSKGLPQGLSLSINEADQQQEQ
ncbi:hypothetical protein OEZ85_005754 [Tetradesmus obliquus]|uniref:Phosphatidylinositol-3,4,5-trisphosphate 3-phosphatase n=1 Tax=Tetradesmus obliquus TaxID=3088 RepID=A0ABY8UHF7_TETOB|nr:hypothetical protein OEZ85_005754 [Tetradesmus obliquus]